MLTIADVNLDELPHLPHRCWCPARSLSHSSAPCSADPGLSRAHSTARSGCSICCGSLSRSASSSAWIVNGLSPGEELRGIGRRPGAVDESVLLWAKIRREPEREAVLVRVDHQNNIFVKAG